MSDEKQTSTKKIRGKNYKRNLKPLPKDFREQIVRYAIEQNKDWAGAAVVLFAVGCRPSELQKGVEVIYHHESNCFRFGILGAKVNELQKRGIDRRVVSVSETKLPDFMIDFLAVLTASQQPGQVFKVEVKNSKTFGNQISAASRELFPKLHTASHASPYSFRHAKASELKNAGFKSETVAKFLGHRSTASQLSYGRRRRGGSGEEPTGYAAGTKTEITKKDRLARFKRKRPKTIKQLASSIPTIPTFQALTPPRPKY